MEDRLTGSKCCSTGAVNTHAHTTHAHTHGHAIFKRASTHTLPREEAHDKEAVARHAPGSAEADAEFEWVAPDESDRRPFSRHWRDILLLASEHDLCLAGEGRAYARSIVCACDSVGV